jgi:hypothetical protein
MTQDATDMPIAVEYVVVVVRPWAAGAVFGGAYKFLINKLFSVWAFL